MKESDEFPPVELVIVRDGKAEKGRVGFVEGHEVIKLAAKV